jgi:hypothetical protein
MPLNIKGRAMRGAHEVASQMEGLEEIAEIQQT